VAGALSSGNFDEFVKGYYHHGDHREHRENIFNYNHLSLWALYSLWLIFSFYEFINFDQQKNRKKEREMLQTKIYSCAAGPQLIFSCSGAADVGELADRVARKLTREGTGKMFCTAGIGGGISGIIEATKSAEKIIALDGCALGCAKCLLEKGDRWEESSTEPSDSVAGS